MERAALIEFKDVTKVKDFDRTKIILEKVNFEIYEGDIISVIGLSGAGKKLILQLIVGLKEPDEGQILYQGKPINHMKKKEWNDYIGNISYVFQKNVLFDSMTVYENVAMPLKYATKLSKQKIDEKVMARIEQTELAEVVDKYPSEISIGMQKRLVLARALITDPSIVLFDEPTIGQDPIRKNAILGMLAEYNKRFGFTAILISHEIPDVIFISDRIIALYDRKIVFEGHADEYQVSNNPLRKELLSSIESLEKRLTGLYSKRKFKIHYQTDLSLSKRHPDAMYSVAIFALDEIDLVSENMDQDATEETIRALGSFINKHFSAVGGFSARQTINEYATVLPYSDLEEAERIMEDFKKDFMERSFPNIQRLLEGEEAGDDCFEFNILAGLAQGKPQIEIESVMEFARFNQKPIARFQCKRELGTS